MYTELINDLKSQGLNFQQIREALEFYSFDKNNEELDEFIQETIATFMDENKIDISNLDYIYRNFFNTYETFEDLFNTELERINENDINVTEANVALADELINRGIVCCACEIGSYLLNGYFEDNVSIEKLTIMADRHYEDLIHGEPLDYSTTVQFVNSLIEKLREKYKNRKLSKAEVIGILNPLSFEGVLGKKYNPSNGTDSYDYAVIDNGSDLTISSCLEEIGLNNVAFSKKANKRIFEVKNKHFGYSSMNSGHFLSKVDVTNDESVKKFIEEKGFNPEDIVLDEESKMQL